MEDKKYLSLKVVHTVLLILALGLNVFDIINAANDVSIYGTSDLAGYVKMASILAIATSFVYLVFGYKKNASMYYKITMGILTFAQALSVMYIMNTVVVPLHTCFLQVTSLILICILASAKDFGEKNSTILVLILIALRVVSVIVVFSNLRNMTTEAINLLTRSISDLLYAGTIGLMVIGKYEDKQIRGSK